MDPGKIKYIKHIIKNTTPKEVKYSIQDVSSLLHSKTFLEHSDIKEMFCEQIERTLQQIPIKGGSSLITAPPGRVAIDQLGQQAQGEEEQEEEESKEVGASRTVQYYDQDSNKYEVDMMSLEGRQLEQGEEETDPFVSAFRPALNNALKRYMELKFYEGAGKASAFVFNNPACAQIFISAHNESYKNFRVGGWVSQWQADIEEASGTFSLKGQVRLNAHYFEDGNLMFKLDKMLEGSGQAQGMQELAEAIVTKIVSLEQKYQNSLEEMYTLVQEKFVKAVRRKLAITGQRFNWQSKLI